MKQIYIFCIHIHPHVCVSMCVCHITKYYAQTHKFLESLDFVLGEE